MAERIIVGGALPGEVIWLDDSAALVWCDHARPLAVYEAACHEGADLDDVIAVPARGASGPGCWYVGPAACLRPEGTMTRLTGYDAIAYAEQHGVRVCKYADPTEGAREDLSPDEAREIAAEDPSLIYLDIRIEVTS